MSQRPDFAQSGRALLELQLQLMREATSAMAANTRRMQEDVDAVLHAFAMMPMAADRIIRAAALAREPQPRQSASTRPPAERKPRRRAPRRPDEHAR